MPEQSAPISSPDFTQVLEGHCPFDGARLERITLGLIGLEGDWGRCPRDGCRARWRVVESSDEPYVQYTGRYAPPITALAGATVSRWPAHWAARATWAKAEREMFMHRAER